MNLRELAEDWDTNDDPVDLLTKLLEASIYMPLVAEEATAKKLLEIAVAWTLDDEIYVDVQLCQDDAEEAKRLVEEARAMETPQAGLAFLANNLAALDPVDSLRALASGLHDCLGGNPYVNDRLLKHLREGLPNPYHAVMRRLTSS